MPYAALHSVEIDTLSKACAITKEGFMRTLDMVKEGIYEYEVEAALPKLLFEMDVEDMLISLLLLGGKMPVFYII